MKPYDQRREAEHQARLDSLLDDYEKRKGLI
jgi:hypothetical protein